MSDRSLTLPVVRAIRDILEMAGEPFDIPGVGRLELQGAEECLFTEVRGCRVFLSYVREDLQAVGKLRSELHRAGLQPWMDRYEILPGQNWRRTIQRAIRLSDFYIPCFSSRAIRKRGTFQRELRYALRCNEEFPLDESFVVPIRLEECDVPLAVASNFQYVDLFQDWEGGMDRLVRSIHSQTRPR